MEKIMFYEDVKDRVEEIVKKILESEQRHLDKERLFLSARCMSYLYLEISKSFEVKIPEEYIVNNKFTNLELLCNIIYDKANVG